MNVLMHVVNIVEGNYCVRLQNFGSLLEIGGLQMVWTSTASDSKSRFHGGKNMRLPMMLTYWEKAHIL
jgi:hypothetical protein